MLSNFFSKSKPIHYLILGFSLLFIFAAAKFSVLEPNLSLLMVSKQLGLFLVCLGSVFIFDFFVTKNKLTQKNSFKMLLFVLFIAVLPETILNTRILLANFFLILALRRMLSLRTHKMVKKKLFDAAFWIAVATLFYFWCILFFILLFTALLVYSFTDIKNYIIPLTGIATVAILAVSYQLVLGYDLSAYYESQTDFSFDFTALNSKRLIIGATLLFSFGLWSLFYYLRNIKSKTKSYRPTFKLIVVTALLAVVIIVLAPSKDGSEFIFLFAPLAIIMTNYLELISEKWFKETFLWILVLTPIFISLL
ncbi:hypothetical protein ESY86_07835 [Subsaximicrobium wynnwilliamsii]|uniref:Beta-carotene 15,15'-monooxygenase n=1 Tax=Subsaximicrobium wynnwilliamsii TaxID=291179 RepID=A0A5C6ZK27_9FLAO|nr:DUF6427 family protein [Subsaximicrobium wynnwilliamsii]TXD83941.1 hypothetical protein ESY87_08000 [Subsaximicrobium wynnwilliamsii]TXD89681.1 hypothetical protein ESY86_07835 [Subsaximicrobium wynnwilliamsii]TXE01666.1 hypothetical protein ESY88_14900 [Subsaximicrobium wynnwilliamsii]